MSQIIDRIIRAIKHKTLDSRNMISYDKSITVMNSPPVHYCPDCYCYPCVCAEEEKEKINLKDSLHELICDRQAFENWWRNSAFSNKPDTFTDTDKLIMNCAWTAALLAFEKKMGGNYQ